MPCTEPTRRQINFLLVEDDEDHADLIRRALRENGGSNQFDHVMDGEAAIALLKHKHPYENSIRPDVILLDLKLPRMNGHEVLETIKSDPDLRSIPVVVLTTSQSEADRTKAYSANANSYLAKPVDFDRFHKMVLDLELYWSVWNQPPPR